MKSMFITLRGIATYLWTGISTFFYSLGAVICLPFSRKAAYQFAVWWCRHLLGMAGVQCRVNHRDKINPKQKYILVCNHQSHFDIPSLMSTLPITLIFVAKKELFRVPFFGWGIKALGHIPIDRSSPRKARESFLKAHEQLQQDDRLSLVIFPEGTRSEDGQVKDFKQGSFALALSTGLPILPVAIRGTRDSLPKNKILARPAKVTITVGEIIDPNQFTRHDKNRLAKTVREQIISLLN